jgi:hypothetical protein
MPHKEIDLANDPTLIGNSQPRHDKHSSLPPNADRMTKSGRQRIPTDADVAEPADEDLTPADSDDMGDKDGNKI